MKCNICGKKVVLVPSARARAKWSGKPASYYTKLFPRHVECELAERERAITALLERDRPRTQAELDALIETSGIWK